MTAARALGDLVVLDLSHALAGPFCSTMLGDYGAEVIKIEPLDGDPMRGLFLKGFGGESAYFVNLNRNKKSVAVDLKSPDGVALLEDLIKDADVLVENFRPGTLEKWGMAPEVLWETNPGLIVTRVTGYGQSGPYSSRAGFGSIGEAMGGIRYVMGEAGRAPVRAGISLGDSLAATYACLGTLVAVHHRERTGRGQVVDSAIYEAVLAKAPHPNAAQLLMNYMFTPAGQEIVAHRTAAVLPDIPGAATTVDKTTTGGVMTASRAQFKTFVAKFNQLFQ